MDQSGPVDGGDAASNIAPGAADDTAPSMDTSESRKRAASQDLAEVIGYALMAALPTLHETDLVAALAGSFLAHLGGKGDGDWQVIHAIVEWEKEYYTAKSGKLLDTERVQKGRQHELANIGRFKVRRDMPNC